MEHQERGSFRPETQAETTAGTKMEPNLEPNLEPSWNQSWVDVEPNKPKATGMRVCQSPNSWKHTRPLVSLPAPGGGGKLEGECLAEVGGAAELTNPMAAL